MSALKKAKIYDPDQPSDSFYVPFNPNSLDYSIGANLNSSKNVKTPDTFEESARQRDPTSQTSDATLTVTLFFHTYTNEKTYTDVRQDINRIRAFLRWSKDKESVASRRIAFAWGTITHIGALESLRVCYQMFASDGTPVQAEATIAICGDDPDIKADAKNRAAELAYENDGKAEWRAAGQLPGGVQWLFT